MPISSLRMYDLPELRGVIDGWWAGVARHCRAAGFADVPDRLSRDGDHRLAWLDPELFLAQTCGYPVTHDFQGRLDIVATPAYRAPGCVGSRYASLVVVRDADAAMSLADLAGRRAAYNSRDSHSGYNAFRGMLAPLSRHGRFLERAIETGSHVASLIAVQEGAADVAAVDCVTFALVRRHRPSAAAGLRILAESPLAPGLPYVTRTGRGHQALTRLRAGLEAAVADPLLAEPREALLLTGFEVLAGDAYQPILAVERQAIEQGYPALA
jgi:ABC-type phosphate/phosphonate transport system substrate-binding protein